MSEATSKLYAGVLFGWEVRGCCHRCALFDALHVEAALPVFTHKARKKRCQSLLA